ncbi:MAG: aminotransferase class V-fold PLP-dependent enzyme, partial [Bdellovibrionota bacterium]
KIGSLAGSGALYVGRGVPVIAAIPGKQEKGRRGGTENGLGLISMGVAASLVNPASWSDSLTPLRDRLEREVRARISGVTVNGAGAPRVGNTINLSFEGVEGDGLVMALDLAGFSVSSGSACSSGVLEPSHVLLALGRTRAQATAAVRISLPGEVSWEELENFVDALDAAVARVRTSRSAYL